MTNIKKKQEGFTIIEVMIVLVIAAVILLIVFLAVPALQRNSRNNQRKSDAGRIASAMSEYASNNNGSLPANATDINSYVGTLAIYGTGTPLQLASQAIANATAAQSQTNAGNQPIIAKKAKCNTSGGTANITGATDRQFVILYAVETSGTDAPQCIGA